MPLLPAPPPPAELLARHLAAAKGVLRAAALVAQAAANGAVGAARSPIRNLTCANGAPLAPCSGRLGEACAEVHPGCFLEKQVWFWWRWW